MKFNARKFVLLAIVMSLLPTSIAFAWEHTIETDIGPLEIMKHYEGSNLVFTIVMPREFGVEDGFVMYLDYEADGGTDAAVIGCNDPDPTENWAYEDYSAGITSSIPSWMAVGTDGTTFTIGIPTVGSVSPLGSTPNYSFALVVGMYSESSGTVTQVVFPEDIEFGYDFEDSSSFEEEEILFPEFVIPETPLGSIVALMSMSAALVLFIKMRH